MNKGTYILIILMLCCFANGIGQMRYDKIDYYLFNFAKNTEWPAAILSDTFYIGVVGGTSANKRLQVLANKNAVKGKISKLKIFESKEDIGFCHLLFVPASYSTDLKAILAKSHKSTLVVTESIGQALKGSGINIIWEDEFSTKMHYEINRSAFERGGLILSGGLSSKKSP